MVGQIIGGPLNMVRRIVGDDQQCEQICGPFHFCVFTDEQRIQVEKFLLDAENENDYDTDSGDIDIMAFAEMQIYWKGWGAVDFDDFYHRQVLLPKCDRPVANKV